MKTAILLPDDLFSAADALAERLGVSRSQLYATAVAEFVAKHSETEVTARLNKLYAAEESGLDKAFERSQRQSLSGKEW